MLYLQSIEGRGYHFLHESAICVMLEGNGNAFKFLVYFPDSRPEYRVISSSTNYFDTYASDPYMSDRTAQGRGRGARER